MERLLRIVVGSVAIAIVVAISYGWSYIHEYAGLTSTHYLYAVGTAIGLWLAYVFGDLILLSYDIRKDKDK